MVLGALTVEALRGLPAHTVRTEFSCSCGDLRAYTFSGPLLHDVLTAEGPVGAGDVAVTSADGYRATLAWDEVAPERGVLLAIEADGRGLAEPRLVVPYDEGGGRCVTRVAEIRVGQSG